MKRLRRTPATPETNQQDREATEDTSSRVCSVFFMPMPEDTSEPCSVSQADVIPACIVMPVIPEFDDAPGPSEPATSSLCSSSEPGLQDDLRLFPVFRMRIPKRNHASFSDKSVAKAGGLEATSLLPHSTAPSKRHCAGIG